MIREAFSQSWWPGLILATCLYISDYACTFLAARAYRARVSSKLVFEGSYELNTFFERDIDSGTRLSPRFVITLVGLNLLLALMWWLTHQPPQWPAGYEFLLGAFVLLQLAIHMRHLRNLYLFHTGFGPDGVQGKLFYPRPVLLRLSAFDILSFGALYLLLFMVSGSWFILGGAGSCLVLGLKQGYLAYRRQKVA